LAEIILSRCFFVFFSCHVRWTFGIHGEFLIAYVYQWWYFTLHVFPVRVDILRRYNFFLSKTISVIYYNNVRIIISLPWGLGNNNGIGTTCFASYIYTDTYHSRFIPDGVAEAPQKERGAILLFYPRHETHTILHHQTSSSFWSHDENMLYRPQLVG
jgi:hypothetical protein